VGEGPFPTELFDDDGETLRKTGVEYGTTTGRPRRCGWMDTVIGRYATRINGVTDFVITKLDVLTGFEQVPICVAYDVEGVRFDEMPMGQSDFHHAKPIYEDSWTAGGRTSRGAAPSRSCLPLLRPMCCESRSSSVRGCPRSVSARGGTRSSNDPLLDA
jgi:adenylosuccinate synthase